MKQLHSDVIVSDGKEVPIPAYRPVNFNGILPNGLSYRTPMASLCMYRR